MLSYIKPLENKEDAWIAEDNDWDGFERKYWELNECPCKDQCSKGALKRAQCWSYEDHEKPKCYMMRHLMASSLHDLDEQQAWELVNGLTCKEYTETYADRKKYRLSQPADAPKADACHGPRQPSDPPPGRIRACRGPRGRSNSRRRRSSRTPMRSRSPGRGDMHASPSSRPYARRRSPIGARQDQQIELARRRSFGGVDMMVQLKNSLQRAAESCRNSQQLAENMAIQFRAEGRVIQCAFEQVDGMLTEILRRRKD